MYFRTSRIMSLILEDFSDYSIVLKSLGSCAEGASTYEFPGQKILKNKQMFATVMQLFFFSSVLHLVPGVLVRYCHNNAAKEATLNLSGLKI